ncbi:TVP38/TMEM64 family protein [Desulfogranum marinum]|jgi:uncharacterized membrane protein YdjX (TVP38/TMEM64 family)|uniref:TVP38/TMEM64 family protein n=1 Tax=Desulfogranum marinum TaxID=453220 RepID=UPI00196344DC|nr:VTT domain-containing protein [Desulfogranum marinum]MBM9512699.1 TVP38/TMEM64 family protein [Desulfogranum marinum]
MSKSMIKKVIIISVILVLVLLFKFFGLGDYLSLDFLKQKQDALLSMYEARPLLILSLYCFTYIGVTALSLPGAAVMTLAGGGLFGLFTGTVAVSFSSTIGATLACIVARFLLRDWVQKKFGDKLVKINQGMAKEGGFYLFSLRLVPLFPFFVINLVMGLTSIRLVTYYWVSQLGMLPATIVYVNAGKELAKIDSLAGILSPRLIVSFALLGFLPILTKKLLALYQAKKGYPSS